MKHDLFVAFAPDPFVVFDKFISHHLYSGETVDEYLGDLQNLVCLVVRGLSNQWLICVFVSGLPSHVRQQLQTSSRMDDME